MFGFDNSKEIKDLKDRIDRFHNIMEKRLSHVEASQPKEAVSLISSIKSIKDNCFILQGKIENSLI